MGQQQGEYVIWKDYSLTSYRRKRGRKLAIISIAMLPFTAFLSLPVAVLYHKAELVPFAVLFLILVIISVIAYILGGRLDEYVVTNIRAMHVKNGKVWRQVYLSTPGLFVTIVNPRYYSDSEESVVSYVVEDVVFLVNGVEVLRFSETRKGDELIAKLRRMGFQ
jgi:hypothetical protein